MVEMHGGKPLFPGRDETHQLAKITETLGGVPATCSPRRAPSGARPTRRSRRNPFSKRGATKRTTRRKRDVANEDERERVVRQAARLAAAPHDHRRRLERARGEAARAAGGKIRRRGGGGRRGDVVARVGSGENGDDSRPADPPSSRASFADAEHAEDAALTSVALFCDVVERLLTYDPELRAQPGTALEHPFFAGDPRRAAGSRGRRGVLRRRGGRRRRDAHVRPGGDGRVSVAFWLVAGNRVLVTNMHTTCIRATRDRAPRDGGAAATLRAHGKSRHAGV